MSGAWRIRLTRQAEQDLTEIASWTAEHFGPKQTECYVETISMAIEALFDGPEVIGTKVRDDLSPGVRTLHCARNGHQARHIVVSRVVENQSLDVLRLFHESMDLARHLK